MVTVGQTRERRIYLHWKSLKDHRDYRREGTDAVWMTLARRWKVPIRDIKEVIEAQRGF